MGLGFCTSLPALAAQNAKVIVPSAKIYLYPQAASKVVLILKEGESIQISNLPTEGFYKMRLPTGELGWVSGNDILASGRLEEGVTTHSNSKTTKAVVDAPRILFGYGFHSLSYDGLKSNFTKTSSLNLGKNFGLELQFRMSSRLYGGVRLEILSADTGAQSIDANTSQTVQVKEVPAQVGIMWSVISGADYRVGLGAYGGGVFSSSAKVTQTSTATGVQKVVEYSTIQLCGTFSTQVTYDFNESLGIFFEGDYRFDQTSKNPDTTVIKATPGFQINYSGILARLGIEIRL